MRERDLRAPRGRPRWAAGVAGARRRRSLRLGSRSGGALRSCPLLGQHGSTPAAAAAAACHHHQQQPRSNWPHARARHRTGMTGLLRAPCMHAPLHAHTPRAHAANYNFCIVPGSEEDAVRACPAVRCGMCARCCSAACRGMINCKCCARAASPSAPHTQPRHPAARAAHRSCLPRSRCS